MMQFFPAGPSEAVPCCSNLHLGSYRLFHDGIPGKHAVGCLPWDGNQCILHVSGLTALLLAPTLEQGTAQSGYSQ